jgi:plastocyanin
MTDALDSRALRLTDCYGQRFMKAGVYRYHVLPVGGHFVTEDRPFTVKVTERPPGKMTQHTVLVKFDGGKFGVDREDITIGSGDLVLWHCPDPKATPYMVIGDKEFFDSHRLVNESGYSHAFGLAGEYHWRDAHGSGAAGVVRVKPPTCKAPQDYERWHRSLAKGTVVMITDARAEPREVEIATGQTVFFAITKGPGISITDERLLARQGGGHPGTSTKPPSSKPRR